MAEIVRTGPTSADFVQGSLRKYDAWGNSRLNSAPSGFHGYCGNLGHKEDPESGLTYMRARYYEPGTGRFISEDPARDGINWYGYCEADPAQKVDPTGKLTLIELNQAISLHARLAAGMGGALFKALSEAGDKVKNIHHFHNLRLDFFVKYATNVTAEIKNEAVLRRFNELFLNNGGAEGWRKVMTTFHGYCRNTGNSYEIEFHFFAKDGFKQIFNPKYFDDF